MSLSTPSVEVARTYDDTNSYTKTPNPADPVMSAREKRLERQEEERRRDAEARVAWAEGLP
jgi:hypothetical protein